MRIVCLLAVYPRFRSFDERTTRTVNRLDGGITCAVDDGSVANAALTGQSVVEALEGLSAHRPLPKAITVDHGTEFTSRALDEWAYRRGVQLDFIRPEKPVENAFIESFNGRLRDESLNVYSFKLIAQAQELIEGWRRDYNDRRPHGALGHLTPSEYAKQRQIHDAEAAELQLRPV